jgi:hypothetical protein
MCSAHMSGTCCCDFSYRNADGSTYDGRYSDWRRRHKDISGWMVGASYVGSDAQGRCANGEFYCFSGSLRSDGSGAVRAAAMRAGRWSSSRSVEASERAWRK